MTANSLTLPTRMSRQLKMVRGGFRMLDSVTPTLAGRIAARMFLTPRKRPYSKRAQEVMSQAKQIPIKHGSRRLATYVWENDGPSILLVHGWESNASGMRAFVRPLLRQGFRVVAFDAPAHGYSAGKQTNMIDYGGALQTVNRNLGPFYGIICHSFGASTTLYTLSRDPAFHVEKVVSIAAPTRLMDMFHAWTGFVGASEPMQNRMMQSIVDRVGIPIETLQIDTAVTKLQVPGLIIHDHQDSIAAFANAEALARNWQTAKLISTDGLDHRGPLQNKQVIRQTVDFLTQDQIADTPKKVNLVADLYEINLS